MDGDLCVTTPNYGTSNYGSRESCTINVNLDYWKGKTIKHESFNTELYFDLLTVNGKDYSGETLPNNLSPTGPITWTTDWSGTRPGWKICAPDGMK